MKKLVLIMTLIAVIAVASSVYLYIQYRDAAAQLAKNIPESDRELQKIVNQISTFMELPQDEVPTLATVSDTSKLPSIPFFSRALTGDNVLIYQKAAKAFLYRPSSKKIIDVSVFTSQNSVNTTESVKKTQLTIELRNGTSIPGLTAAVEQKLSQLAPESIVQQKNPAKRKDYTDSIVIARDSSMEKTAADIAKRLDFAVGPLPSKEASVSTDILIIVGSDSKTLE